jgi:hypothetical protein
MRLVSYLSQGGFDWKAEEMKSLLKGKNVHICAYRFRLGKDLKAGI